MMQRNLNPYREQFIPEIDHRQAVWGAYQNCLMAFQGIDMMGGSEGGATVNISRTPQERFVYSLAVLDGMIEDDKTPEFKEVPPPKVTELLKENPPNEFGRFDGFYKYLEYWTRLDRLMRDQAMFTTGKVPHGRI